MGKETRLFKSEEQKSREEVSVFLRHLADRISEGRVQLSQGQEAIELNLPGTLILEVQVEEESKGSKGVQHSLEVEIKWYEEGQQGPLELS